MSTLNVENTATGRTFRFTRDNGVVEVYHLTLDDSKRYVQGIRFTDGATPEIVNDPILVRQFNEAVNETDVATGDGYLYIDAVTFALEFRAHKSGQ